MSLSPSDFSAQFAALRPTLLAYVERFIADTNTAEDIVSDTYPIGISRLGAYDETLPLKAWLKGICLNLLRENLRASARCVPLDPALLPVRQSDSFAETRRQFHQALLFSDLTPKQAIVLRWAADGWRPSEIGKRLGIKDDAVKHLLARARSRAWKNRNAWVLPLKTGQEVVRYKAPTTVGACLAREGLRKLAAREAARGRRRAP